MTAQSIIQLLEHTSWRPTSPAAPIPSTFLGRSLPEDYLALMRWSNGGTAQLGTSPLSCCELWPFELLEANQGLVNEYMPDCISIGGDGASREFVIDYRSGVPGSVLSVDRGDMGWNCDTLRILGATLLDALLTLRDVPPGVDRPSLIGRPA